MVSAFRHEIARAQLDAQFDWILSTRIWKIPGGASRLWPKPSHRPRWCSTKRL